LLVLADKDSNVGPTAKQRDLISERPGKWCMQTNPKVST